MAEVDVLTLQCSICLRIISEPKLLSCSHYFCHVCLQDLTNSQSKRNKVPCPLCQKVSAVPHGDVNQLQTYEALQILVHDVINRQKVCTSCDDGNRTLAVTYCQNCRKYMCDGCYSVHFQWKGFADHRVVAAHEVSEEQVILKKRSRCKNHPNEDATCFCMTCSANLCFCSVLEHTRQGHHILEAYEHEGGIRSNIEELNGQAGTRKNTVQQYVAYIKEQRQHIQEVLKRLHGSIDTAYEDSVQKLQQRRDILKAEVAMRIDELEETLKNMEGHGDRLVVQVDAGCSLINHGLDACLEGEALLVHQKLCQEMQGIVKLENPDYKPPMLTSKRGDKIIFKKNSGLNELDLGQIQVSEWAVKHTELPNKSGITAMVASPDGTMALAGNKGGLSFFSERGQLQRTEMQNVKIREIQFLSDGRFILRDKTNTISMFSPTFNLQQHMRFETRRSDEAGSGNLSVDGSDNIYAAYRKAGTIQIFKPSGGRAFREIFCNGFEPSQVFAMKTQNNLLVQSHSNSVRMIDHTGSTLHDLTLYDNIYGYPTIWSDGTIMIAWVKHEEGLVGIDQYTSELQHMSNLITDHRIEKPEKRLWYHLQEFKKGEIAFCTPDKMYIFKQAIATTTL